MPPSTDDYIARAIAQANAAHQGREQLQSIPGSQLPQGVFVVGSHITIVGSMSDSHMAVGGSQADQATTAAAM